MSAFHFIDLPTYGRVTRDREPNLCPHCAHKIAPEELDWNVSSTRSDQPLLECTCRCTNQECQRLFIALYHIETIVPKSEVERLSHSHGSSRYRFSWRSSVPPHIPQTSFSNELASLSGSFVEIYKQAEEAEALGLNQICGLGYRKAVEFLVKDYCVSRAPPDKETILSSPLAQCISRFIDDGRIKDMATRAAWLGNDEAHYVRKWIDKDISDLKLLVRLLCNWIESSILTDQYRNNMPPTK